MDSVPDKYRHYEEYMESWRSNHPQYEYIFWNGDRIEELWNREELKRWRQYYDRIDVHIQKCDFTRYAILYLYGGLYVDLDFISLRPIDDLLNREILVTLEPKENAMISGMTCIANNIMGSVKGNEFWIGLMDYIVDGAHLKNRVIRDAVSITGPYALYCFYQSLDVRPDIITDVCLLTPMTLTGSLSQSCTLDKSYCYTRWTEGTGWHLDKDNIKSVSIGYTKIGILVLLLISVLVIVLIA